MISVTVQTPHNGHTISWNDLPRAGVDIRPPLEAFDASLMHVLGGALTAREVEQIDELPAYLAGAVDDALTRTSRTRFAGLGREMHAASDARRRLEERLELDKNLGIEHRREMSFDRGHKLLIRVKVRPQFARAIEDELWMDRRIPLHLFENHEERVRFVGAETLEVSVARMVFDALEAELRKAPKVESQEARRFMPTVER